MITAIERSENVSLMEPLLISESAPKRGMLIDLALDAAAKAAGSRRSLPDGYARHLRTSYAR